MSKGPADAAKRALIIGAGLSALWLLMLLFLWWAAPENPAPGARRWLSLVAGLLPLMLIWLAVGLAHAIAGLRAEAETLRHQLEEMRTAGRAGAIPAAPTEAPPQPEPPAPTAVPSAPKQRPQSPSRPRPAAPSSPDPRQPSLSLDAPDPVALDHATMIRALAFPDGPDDQPAIEALRKALRDPDTARLLRAAQDVVTLLAEYGLFMDDITPDPVPQAHWAHFAEGGRGTEIAGFGRFADAAPVATVTSHMRSDEIFRDAAHHFLRLFERMLPDIAAPMSPEERTALEHTRSLRAFMLCGRAAGLFGAS